MPFDLWLEFTGTPSLQPGLWSRPPHLRWFWYTLPRCVALRWCRTGCAAWCLSGPRYRLEELLATWAPTLVLKRPPEFGDLSTTSRLIACSPLLPRRLRCPRQLPCATSAPCRPAATLLSCTGPLSHRLLRSATPSTRSLSTRPAPSRWRTFSPSASGVYLPFAAWWFLLLLPHWSGLITSPYPAGSSDWSSLSLHGMLRKLPWWRWLLTPTSILVGTHSSLLSCLLTQLVVRWVISAPPALWRLRLIPHWLRPPRWAVILASPSRGRRPRCCAPRSSRMCCRTWWPAGLLPRGYLCLLAAPRPRFSGVLGCRCPNVLGQRLDYFGSHARGAVAFLLRLPGRQRRRSPAPLEMPGLWACLRRSAPSCVEITFWSPSWWEALPSSSSCGRRSPRLARHRFLGLPHIQGRTLLRPSCRCLCLAGAPHCCQRTGHLASKPSSSSPRDRASRSWCRKPWSCTPSPSTTATSFFLPLFWSLTSCPSPSRALWPCGSSRCSRRRCCDRGLWRGCLGCAAGLASRLGRIVRLRRRRSFGSQGRTGRPRRLSAVSATRYYCDSYQL